MGNKFLCLVAGICSLYPSVMPDKLPFNVVHQWNHLEFDYPTENERQGDISSGLFVPGKAVPIDVDVHYSTSANENRIFVTIPRFQSGAPITFGTITHRQRDGNPLIAPYPSWDWQRDSRLCKSQRIVSVFRVMVDRCNRLWVLDTGKLLEEQICAPQILAFDLDSNRLIYKHEIPKSLLKDMTLLVTPVVDVRDSCQDTFIYSADCQTNSIFVHDVRNKSSWKVQDKTMYPDPAYGTYTIQGDSFELMDGVLGMALEPYIPGRDRKLFYHAMSSGTEQNVQTSAIRNSAPFLSDPGSSPQLFYKYKGSRRTQSAAEAISKDGIMFFGLMSDVKIACFNIRDEYGPGSIDIVADNSELLQFASGVKVIRNKKKIEELWILTSRFQKVMNNNLSKTGPNFRILAARVDDLVMGTRCRKFRGDNEAAATGGYGLVQS